MAIRKRVGTFDLAVQIESTGGITALFGPSGSGKTQTLRCIAGLTHPDDGRIVVNDQVLFDHQARINVPARERHVGYMFQQYALFPHLNVAANVAFGLQGLSREEKPRRISEMLELVGLAGFDHRRPRELSGGQQQRVALARALAPHPALLLLDEPFSAVDAMTRGQLRGQLRAIHERTGIPMVLVTHDHLDVQELASLVAVYDHGRIAQLGRPVDLLPVDETRPQLVWSGAQ